MKLLNSIVLLAILSLLGSGCVSRTVTTEKGYGKDTTEKKVLWIWQDEYRNMK